MSYVTIAPPPPSRPIIRSIFPDATPLVNNNGANFFHPGSQLKPVLSALSTAGATLKPGAKEWTNYSRKVESAKRFRQLVEHLKWRHAQPAALEMPRSYVQVEKVSSGLAEKPGRAPILSSSRDSLCGNTLHDAECESQRDRCVDIFFFHIMLENCAQTCGFCEANGWVRVAGGGRGGARSVKDGGGDSSSASRKQVLFKNLNPIKFGCFYFWRTVYFSVNNIYSSFMSFRPFRHRSFWSPIFRRRGTRNVRVSLTPAHLRRSAISQVGRTQRLRGHPKRSNLEKSGISLKNR